MNYRMIDDTQLQMQQGIFGGVTGYQTYESGELESVNLNEKNMIVTHAGEIVPAYTETPRRKKKPSVEFYKNGMIKAVMLDEQSELETPIGTLPAEYITFFPTGEIHRIFITDGQISGFWSEEEEKQFNIPLSFEFDFASFTAYLNGICFYKSGCIKSITLYPGEKVNLNTTAGEIETGIGFSLYEDGTLESVEPFFPIVINTPIGQFTAFDSESVGIHADSNSVRFDEKKRLVGFSTVENKVLVQTKQEEFLILKPEEKMHPLQDDEMIKKPMKIFFDLNEDKVTITSDEERVFPMKETGFTIQKIDVGRMGCSPSDCASCSLCSSKNTAMK
ncbi:MAG: hypothetical protein PHY47_19990 [Lachnospiraceae bacterium]|nr:hypothetical protein [Lachnospiraceae bacterium]